MAKGGDAKGPGDELDLNEPSTVNLMETSNEAENESHSQTPYTSSNPSNGNKHVGGRKRTFLDDEHFEAAFSSVSKSLQCLVEVEKENAAAMKDIKSALVHEVEVQKKIDAQGDQLFEALCALPGFTDDEIVKAACIIGKDVEMLKLFFRAPADKKSAFVRHALASGQS